MKIILNIRQVVLKKLAVGSLFLVFVLSIAGFAAQTTYAAAVVINSVMGAKNAAATEATLINFGVPGGLLYINGSGFSGNANSNLVFYGVESLPIINATDTQIIVRIPPSEPLNPGKALNVKVGTTVSNQVYVSTIEAVADITDPNNPITPPATGAACGGGVLGGLGCVRPQFDPKGSVAGAQNIGDFIIAVINVLLGLLLAISVLFIIIGGYQYVTSAGKEDQAKSGRRTVTYAVIGVAVAILSYMIVRVVEGTLSK
ncbi:MAG: IPT/TIG domain-containing protein [Candidatus Doudnabacteria bacterium]|nr:IPT/TIG domain-containing protein [Candidatus Doudnabacteria bacterium]